MFVRGFAGVSKVLLNFEKLCAEPRREMGHRFRGHMPNRHRDPKWKKYRANQTFRLKLPDYEEMRKDFSHLSPDEIRSLMKEKGIVPGRLWIEKPVFMSCTGTVIDAFVPPEGDGKATILSKTGALQQMRKLEKKGKSLMQLRKIRQFDEDFDLEEFAQQAHTIYEEAHLALANGDKKKLGNLVTERCYPEMLANTELKTLRWSLIKSIEPARVVTVRLHTQQTLAIYDRFGRLMHGSEAITKDVLEYVVFEKHMSNEYGQWKLHAKIIPEWQPVKSPEILTNIVEGSPVNNENLPANLSEKL
ncbi:probable 39S ribosomal protein L45, mitochondrial isoform X2 [Varroa jacobsoni]|uniref:Large ribosomal subunit protein mL45 n=1 Tax=Varroa destructor TaxID=109461 RepID=A0A7M7KVE1_VARDE|nr:probable 39S ribosomal protein L45, mitochondrial isoform X2 [Varroa destructor]XP_022691307.1 probable 39S ribosomal protein L45, mitochondrial isoform X2 [Varroa jacobsoni]